MNGVITALFNRGQYGSYGFIKDERGDDRFFPADGLAKGLIFGEMKKHAKVTFDPTTGGRDNKGLRATNVRLAE